MLDWFYKFQTLNATSCQCRVPRVESSISFSCIESHDELSHVESSVLNCPGYVCMSCACIETSRSKLRVKLISPSLVELT